MPRGLSAVPRTVNVAAPHLFWEAAFEGKIVYDPRELKNTTAHFHRTAIDPSQSVFSSIGDMSRWAQFLMRADDGPVLSAKAVRTLRQLTSILGSGNWMVNQQSDRLKAVGHGLGMEMFRYRDHALFGHDGSELGYGARMLIDPAAGFAVVILINNQTPSLYSTISMASRQRTGPISCLMRPARATRSLSIRLRRSNGACRKGRLFPCRWRLIPAPIAIPSPASCGSCNAASG